MKPLSIFDASLAGFSLVEAGAGTGKTYNITSLYIRAIVENELTPKQILVLTYTEAATIELKSRIRGRIKESLEVLKNKRDTIDDPFLKELVNRSLPNWVDLLSIALQGFDEATIYTIHGFCQKLLREESISFGVQPDFEVLKDPAELHQDAIDDYWTEVVKKYSSDEKGKSLLRFLIEQKLTVDELSNYILPILSKPYALVKPDNLDSNLILQAIDGLWSNFELLRKSWHSDKAQILDIINSKVLSGNTYNKGVKTKTIRDIDFWLDDKSRLYSIPNKLALFSSSVMMEKTNKGKVVNPPAFSVLLDEFMGQYDEFSKFKEWFILSALNEIKEKIHAFKKAKNVLGFDDFLQLVDQNLDLNLSRKIALKYPIALVDEFQDTDPIQYSIFKKIYRNSNSALFMIGDPKQAIYSFRGADLYTYFSATQEVPEEKIYSLNANYRSDKLLIEAVNKLFSVQKHPFILQSPSFSPAQFPHSKKSLFLKRESEQKAATQFIEIDYDEYRDGNSIDDIRKRVSTYTANQISDLLSGSYTIGERPVKASDIAVLVKKNAEAEKIHQSLYEIGIQSLLKSKDTIYGSREALELKDILKAILNSNNDGLVKAALSTDFIGYKAHQITSLAEHQETLGGVVNTFNEARQLWGKQGIVAAIEWLNKEFHIEENLSQLSTAERRLTNYYHLQELLIKIENENNSSPSTLYRLYQNKLNNVGEVSDDELLRLESDEDLVTITTMHSSKGLEYPIVILPFLWDDMLYSSNKNKVTQYHNADNNLIINIGSVSDEDKDQQKYESIADAMRLAYVAFTRAEVVNIIPIVDSNIKKSTIAALLFGAKAYLSDSKNTEFNYPALIDALKSLEQQYCIEVKKEDELELRNHIESNANESIELSVNQFHRNNLDDLTRVVSFSSLSQHTSTNSDGFDFDFDERASEESKDDEKELNRFTFPRGAEAGNLLHDIFEFIEFDASINDIEEVISDKLSKWGYSNKWKSVLNTWIVDVIATKLHGDISISNLSNQDVLKEMEFHFTIDDLDPLELSSTIRNQKQLPLSKRESIRGFMKGFIDLIFRVDGKYYILDYKSNHLGDHYDDYNPDKLTTAIINSEYDIQFHIYVLALKKYLEARDPNFNYDRDFGGVYYLFLRGMHPTKGLNGIFFERPDSLKINQLDEIINYKNR